MDFGSLQSVDVGLLIIFRTSFPICNIISLNPNNDPQCFLYNFYHNAIISYWKPWLGNRIAGGAMSELICV